MTALAERRQILPPAPREEREGLLARCGKLLRTTAFKLSLTYLVVFALLAYLALGYVAWSARRVLDDQITATIEAELNGLSEQYTAGGLRRLISVVERRASEPGASLYLVTTPAGEHIVGNVANLPAGLIGRQSEVEAFYARQSDPDRLDHHAVMRIYNLAGGFRLLVGRDTEERDRLREAISNTFGTALAFLVLIGVAGGWFVASRVLKRVDDMTRTTRSIMGGGLDERLHVSGSGDELDRLARNINQMLDRIGELMLGMKEVSDNIAHDLKTPLTRLRNRADDALRTSSSPEAYRQALEGVISESDGLIRVFEALLTIARLEAGSVRESFVRFDAGVVLHEVAELYEALAEERGFTLKAEAELGLMLDGNRDLVAQALANLADNAIKYGEGSEPTITMRARRSPGRIELSVADHGAGVPESERSRVLDRFVRLEEARTRPGFGLGLSLVAAVARLHGGSLALEDNGPGLRVVLSLPAPNV